MRRPDPAARYQVTAEMVKIAMGFPHVSDRMILDHLHSNGVYFYNFRPKLVLSNDDFEQI